MKTNCLIVCYSNTGNTHQVASAIQKLTGGMLCDIYPRQPYPMDFQQLLKQVRHEIHTGFRPSLLPGYERPDAYDTVFVGSPIWCGTIAPPMASYLTRNRLKGKVIVPFYTHCGGGTGNIEPAVKRLCPDSLVLKGCNILNDGGDQLDKTIATWLEEHNL